MKTIYLVWQGRHEDARLIAAAEDKALADRWAKAHNRTGPQFVQPDTSVEEVAITSSEPVERVEGEKVIVTDFAGVEHEATLELLVGPMHEECDDEERPCSHAFWAAVWEIDMSGAERGKASTVWPIGDNWERVRKAQ